MTINPIEVAGTWLAQPRLAGAIRAVEASPTAQGVLGDVAAHPTRVRFEAAPRTVEEFERRQANEIGASYRPFQNLVQFGAGFGVDEPFRVAGRDGGTVLVDFGDTAARDGIYLVHESQHRLQARGGRMVLDTLLLQPVLAPVRGVRELLAAPVGESRRAAFARGFDRSLMRGEIEAYRIDDRVSFELGQKARYHDAQGAYAGDDAVLADTVDLYRRNQRLVWAASTALLGGGAAGVARTAHDAVVADH